MHVQLLRVFKCRSTMGKVSDGVEELPSNQTVLALRLWGVSIGDEPGILERKKPHVVLP